MVTRATTKAGRNFRKKFRVPPELFDFIVETALHQNGFPNMRWMARVNEVIEVNKVNEVNEVIDVNEVNEVIDVNEVNEVLQVNEI